MLRGEMENVRVNRTVGARLQRTHHVANMPIAHGLVDVTAFSPICFFSRLLSQGPSGCCFTSPENGRVVQAKQTSNPPLRLV